MSDVQNLGLDPMDLTVQALLDKDLNNDESFYITELPDDESKIKSLIKKYESVFRRLPEYKKWKETLCNRYPDTLYTCALTKLPYGTVPLELHHYPITLYGMTYTVIQKQLSVVGRCNTLTVAWELLRIHFEEKVGIISLCSTLHQYAHNTQCPLPLQFVVGDYQSFIDEYEQYMPDDVKNLVHKNIEYSTSRYGDLNEDQAVTKWSMEHLDIYTAIIKENTDELIELLTEAE